MSLRLTFRQTKSICCSQVKFLSIVIPKCFCALTDLSTVFVYCDGGAFISRCHMLRTYHECMCFAVINSHITSMHHVLKSSALICSLGLTTSSFLHAVWVIVSSAYICVRLQLKWHVVYKYKEQNRSQHGAFGIPLLTDWRLDTFNLSTTHLDLFERYDSNQRKEPIFAEAFHDQQHQKLLGRRILIQQCSPYRYD